MEQPLHLNEQLMMVESVDETGSFSGVFNFPSGLHEDEVHFLTAYDPFSKEFAYSITCPYKVPKIEVEPLAYNFGSIVIGESSNTLELTISNTGYAALDISLITQANSTDFSYSFCQDILNQLVLMILCKLDLFLHLHQQVTKNQ